jgi:hypothetical protein
MIRVIVKKRKMRKLLKNVARKEKTSDDEAEESSITIYEQVAESGAVGGVQDLNKYGKVKKAEKEKKEKEEKEKKDKDSYEASYSQAAKRFWAFKNVFKRQKLDVENVGVSEPLQHMPQPAEVKYSVDEQEHEL